MDGFLRTTRFAGEDQGVRQFTYPHSDGLYTLRPGYTLFFTQNLRTDQSTRKVAGPLSFNNF